MSREQALKELFAIGIFPLMILGYCLFIALCYFVFVRERSRN